MTINVPGSDVNHTTLCAPYLKYELGLRSRRHVSHDCPQYKDFRPGIHARLESAQDVRARVCEDRPDGVQRAVPPRDQVIQQPWIMSPNPSSRTPRSAWRGTLRMSLDDEEDVRSTASTLYAGTDAYRARHYLRRQRRRLRSRR